MRNGQEFSTRKQIFTCPHCGERISIMVDLSVSQQSYIEDCEVCCNPIEIIYQTEDGIIVSFEARIT